MNKIWLIGIVIIIAVLLVATGSYNEMITKQEGINSEFANLDAQLQRRADLIPNLVSTVKGYTKQESDIFTNLINARTKYVNSTDIGEKLQASTEISIALNSFLAITENYPILQSTNQFTQLMDELAGTENRIAVARKDYNEIVKEYNTLIKKFPNNMIASSLGFEMAPYFEADVASKEVPNVNFE